MDDEEIVSFCENVLSNHASLVEEKWGLDVPDAQVLSADGGFLSGSMEHSNGDLMVRTEFNPSKYKLEVSMAHEIGHLAQYHLLGKERYNNLDREVKEAVAEGVEDYITHELLAKDVENRDFRSALGHLWPKFKKDVCRTLPYSSFHKQGDYIRGRVESSEEYTFEDLIKTPEEVYDKLF